MGIVGRKGKLSITAGGDDVREIAWQRYEDVLTADVFGAYRYLPPSLGILPILYKAIDENRQNFSHYLRRFGIDLSTLDVVRIRFWPVFKDGREPDVFVLLESTKNEHSVALLVEAKYHASQHEIGESSQVGHYLIQHLADAYADDNIAWDLPESPRPLLFLTKHQELPASELRRARKEVHDEYQSLPREEVGVFWTNWATVGREAQRLWRENRAAVDSKPWLRHLLDLYDEIRDRDLLAREPFDGIDGPNFGNPRFRYLRTYVQSVLPGSENANSCQSSCGTPLLTRANPRKSLYTRDYMRGHIKLDGWPAVYVNDGKDKK